MTSCDHCQFTPTGIIQCEYCRATDALMRKARKRTPEVALLRLAIERSGLSARAFAKDILLRDERTVRRWLAGDSPIPQAVIDWLRESAK